MIDGLLEKAKELLKKPEMIIDIYDFTIVWMSDDLRNLLGYKEGEIEGKIIADILGYDKEDKKRQKTLEHMNKKHGFMKSILKTRKGDLIEFDVEFYTIKFKDGYYHIGTDKGHKKISPNKK